MSRLICLLGLFAGVLSVVSLTGCGQSGSSVDPEVLAMHRVRLTLAEEPDGAQVVPDVRDALLGISDDHDGHDHGGHTEHSEDDGHDHADHENGDDDDNEGEDEDGDDDADDDDADDDDADDDDADDDDADDDDADDDDADDDDADDDDADDDDADDDDADDDDDEGDEDELDHDEHADHDHEEDGHDEHAHHDHADHDGHDHGATTLIKATEPMEVVLVGQIGGLSNPWKETQPDFPFARNQAAFFLADPLTVIENEESGHVHAPGEECAFCEAHAADRSAMLAMVRFLDEKGEVLRMDVRDLFDVKESDTVVIQGTARVIEGGMMVVDATGLYHRQ